MTHNRAAVLLTTIGAGSILPPVSLEMIMSRRGWPAR